VRAAQISAAPRKGADRRSSGYSRPITLPAGASESPWEEGAAWDQAGHRDNANRRVRASATPTEAAWAPQTEAADPRASGLSRPTRDRSMADRPAPQVLPRSPHWRQAAWPNGPTMGCFDTNSRPVARMLQRPTVGG